MKLDRYNLEIRHHRRMHHLARLGLSAAVGLIGIALGTLIACSPLPSASDAVVTLAMFLILAWGLWGLCYISTRH